MGPTPSQINAKCDVVMKLSVFGTQTDRHTHKAKPIQPHVAGCNQYLKVSSYSHSGDIVGGIKNLNRLRDHNHVPFGDSFFICLVRLDIYHLAV